MKSLTTDQRARAVWAAALCGAALLASGVATPALAATPAWLNAKYAPQLPAPFKTHAVLEDDGPTAVTATRGVLVCNVSIEPKSKGWDNSFRPSRRAPDPAADVRVGGQRVRVVGRDDTHNLSFSVPGVSLKRGARVRIRVEDRDISRHDHIATFSTRLGKKWPLTFKKRWASGSCYLLPRASFEAKLPALVKTADEKIAAFTAAITPDLTAANGGYPVRAHEAALDAMRGVGGYVGWADPQAAALIKKFSEAQRRWDTLAGAAVITALGKLPADGQPARVRDGSVEVTRVKTVCGKRAVRRAYGRLMRKNVHVDARKTVCVTELKVTNRSQKPVRVNSFFGEVGPFGKGTRFVGVLSNGLTSAADWVGVREGRRFRTSHKKDLAPGATVTVVLAMKANPMRAHEAAVKLSMIGLTNGSRAINREAVLLRAE